MMQEFTNAANDKRSYARPELQVFGSVRNLTGGSLGGLNDGSGARTMRNRPR